MIHFLKFINEGLSSKIIIKNGFKRTLVKKFRILFYIELKKQGTVGLGHKKR